MKVVVENYGSTIIAVLLGLVLLSNFGYIKNQLSYVMNTAHLLSGDDDRSSFNHIKNEGIPYIEVNELEIVTNEKIECNNLFTITQNAQNLQNIEIYEVIDETNNCHPEVIQDNGASLYFSSPGIYTLYIKIVCKNKMEDYCAISIPVNNCFD